MLLADECDSSADNARGVAEQHGLELDELFAMADYCNLDLQVDDSGDSAAAADYQQRERLLVTAARAATLPLEARWSMHVARGGKM